MMARLPKKSHEATSSRAQERNEKRMPSAPPMPELNVHSTFKPRGIGPSTQEVPIRSNYTPKPTTRMTMLEKKLVLTF